MAGRTWVNGAPLSGESLGREIIFIRRENGLETEIKYRTTQRVPMFIEETKLAYKQSNKVPCAIKIWDEPETYRFQTEEEELAEKKLKDYWKNNKTTKITFEYQDGLIRYLEGPEAQEFVSICDVALAMHQIRNGIQIKKFEWQETWRSV